MEIQWGLATLVKVSDSIVYVTMIVKNDLSCNGQQMTYPVRSIYVNMDTISKTKSNIYIPLTVETTLIK